MPFFFSSTKKKNSIWDWVSQYRLNFSRKKKNKPKKKTTSGKKKTHRKSWKRKSGKILEIKHLVNLKKYLLQGFFHDFVLTIFQKIELVQVKLCQGNKKKQLFFFPNLRKKKNKVFCERVS